MNQTWSCYQGEDIHCGKCGTCVERIEAFKLSGVVDWTEYQDESQAQAGAQP
jgi:7-cyano-7-deazaguanine synthase